MKDERRDYSKDLLREEDLSSDPLTLLQSWIEEARKSELDPTAFVLSTSVKGQPSSRVVLLKEIRSGQLVFFTNYQSQKGMEISLNPMVSLNFFWASAERQVRVLGKAERISAAESDQYFYSRPFESQVGAMVSHQSETLSSREALDNEFEAALKDKSTLKRPEHWGGFAITPHEIEFWQGRPSRLHDRFQYQWTEGRWEIRRLYP